jgi:DNA-3-methyladenine glycosylase
MIDRTFFQRDPVSCARELIGCDLVWNSCAGTIVETEAYAAVGDEACHTFVRPSTRAFIANHQPGTAYVYFNYGMYWLFNVLIKGGTEDGFVLIRALQPTHGLDAMQQRRFPGKPTPTSIQSLCSGPGKLTIALGISGHDHGRDLCSVGSFGFRHGSKPKAVQWVSDLRVGITKSTDLRWRFLAANNAFVSAKLGFCPKSRKPGVNK